MDRLQMAEQFRKALQMFAASLDDEKAMEVAAVRVRQDLIDNSVDPNGSLWDTLYAEAMAQAAIDVTAELNGQEAVGLLVASVAEDSGLYGKLEKNDMITHIIGVAITDDDMALYTNGVKTHIFRPFLLK